MSEKIFLKQTILHNIQSHKHTVIDWDEGLNVIIGASDSGKTAMQRGINWNLYNESGSELIRNRDNETDKHGNAKQETLAYVTNVYSNGVTVTRKFDKNTNIYEVIDENGEIFSFDGFRNDVPEMVGRLTGISPMIITETLNLNLNIVASRGRSLIDLNGAEKAQIIGAFADANVIDVSIKEVNAEIKRTSDAASKAKTEVEKFDKDIEALGDMTLQEELVQKIDNLYFSITETNYLRNDIVSLKKSIEEKMIEIEVQKKVLASLSEIEDTEKKLKIVEATLVKIKDAYTDLTGKRERLTLIRNRINGRVKEIEDSKVIVKKHADLDKEENTLLKLEINLNNLQKDSTKIKEKKTRLEKHFENINSKLGLISRDKSIVEKYKDVSNEEKVLTAQKDSLDLIKEKIEQTNTKKEALLKSKTSINLKIENGTKLKESILHLSFDIENLVEDCVDAIKEMGKCPLCLSNIDEEHLGSIRKELEE